MTTRERRSFPEHSGRPSLDRKEGYGALRIFQTLHMTASPGTSLPTAVLRRRQQDTPTPFDRHRNCRPFRVRLRRLMDWHHGLAPDGGISQQHRNPALVERLLDVAVDLPIAAGFVLGESADLHAALNRSQVLKTICLEGELPPAVAQDDSGVVASACMVGGLVHTGCGAGTRPHPCPRFYGLRGHPLGRVEESRLARRSSGAKVALGHQRLGLRGGHKVLTAGACSWRRRATGFELQAVTCPAALHCSRRFDRGTR